MTAGHGEGRRPLEGVRVADFCWVWAGPYCTMLLGALGAEVIKVEGPRRTDLMRRGVVWPLPEPAPVVVPPNQGMSYNSVNMAKKSLTLDLAQPEGIALAKRLVAASDIVVDNMRAGAMERMGLGYAELCQVREDIIVVSMSSRGHTGPQRDYAGYATIHHAIGGGAYITGYPDDAPCTSLGDVDLMNGMTAAFAALAALHHRLLTGQGQFIDFAQTEGVTSLIGDLVLGYQLNGVLPERMGNAHPYYAPHNVYRCWGVDRWLALEIHSDEEFAVLAGIIGRPGLAQDPRFATAPARKANEAALDSIIEAWTCRRDRDWMVQEFTRAGLMAAPSRDWRDLCADRHLRARGAFVRIDHPELGELELVGVPWKMGGAPEEVPRAPLLGEHNEYVLGEVLGLGDSEITGLRQKGVIL